MREVSIDAHMYSRINNGKTFFYSNEIPKNFPSIAPGEWLVLTYLDSCITAFGNDFVVSHPKLWIVSKQKVLPVEYINEMLTNAIKRRNGFYENEGKRLVFGQNDFLPGLIVDQFEKIILIQINTAGLDNYREVIKTFFQHHYKAYAVYFLDNPSYRKDESLPVYEKDWRDNEEIKINDSGIIYKLQLSKIQKVGFYYDHRDNRNKFERYLEKVSNKENALDLFSYMGAWGLHALRAGAKNITFVDQADLESEVIQNVKNLAITSCSKFIRSDVFKYLDKAIEEKMKWEVVICDPPAFCKSLKQKNQAVSGYQKLFNRIFKTIASNGTLVAASCTKYISLQEFTQIVEQQAKENNRVIWLRDIGIQAIDHPIKGLSDSGNYIKFALYNVE